MFAKEYPLEPLRPEYPKRVGRTPRRRQARRPRSEDLEGYTVNFVTFHEDIDAIPLMKGLPDDRCQCHVAALLTIEPNRFAESQGDQALPEHVLHRLAEAEVDSE